MKNVMVANRQSGGRYGPENIDILLKAQIENSIECGWSPKDILLISNFKFQFMGVKAYKAQLNDFCLTGSKLFGLKWALDKGLFNPGDVIWTHDLDAWQNCWFDPPKFKDVGISTYSKPKFNGGSIFWRPESRYILESVLKEIEKGAMREEPTLNVLLNQPEFRCRVTVLNNTYNVGCSGFVKRAERATLPIRVCHMNPLNRIAWDTHTQDRNKVGIVSVGLRLERLLRRYYPNLATEPLPRKEKRRKGNGTQVVKKKRSGAAVALGSPYPYL